MVCAVTATGYPHDDDDEAENIPLTSGSVAEFYINPMLPCIGDVDVMYYDNSQLAIPAGYPPPTQLPDEFHDYVKIFEIIGRHLGFAYLKLRYLLTVSTDDDAQYNATQCDKLVYLMHGYDCGKVEIHGPALSYASRGSISASDRVFCTRCLWWPTQASDWPTRHRNYGWPDSATINRVTSNGCDLVCVAHRQCRA